jgi:hypothetical protein
VGTPTQRHCAKDLICADLEAQRRRKRAHFMPALLLSGIVIVGSIVVFGARPDLLQQPPAQLALQIVLWVACLFVFPAIGVGLLFPGRVTRLLLAVGAIAMTLIATTGWPFASCSLGAHTHGSFGGCVTITLGMGVLLLAIGFLSGAFVQRRGLSAVFWVGAGLSLMALNVITWHCPQSGLLHVLPAHLGGAVMLLVLAVVVGVVARSK